MAFVSAAKVLSRLTCVFDLNPFIPFVVQEKKERKGGLSKSVSLREQFFLSCEKQGTKKKIGAPKVKKKKKRWTCWSIALPPDDSAATRTDYEAEAFHLT